MNAVHKRAMEAAERRRAYLESEIRVSPLLVLADCQDIADGYLAEHPADDELPVTREWLITFPGRVVDPSSKDTILIQIGGNDCVAVESDMTVAIQQGMYEDEDSQYIAIPISPMTRRQFRQLLAGLGIATEAAP